MIARAITGCVVCFDGIERTTIKQGQEFAGEQARWLVNRGLAKYVEQIGVVTDEQPRPQFIKPAKPQRRK